MITKKKILNENNELLTVETYEPDVINSTVIFCHGITGCRKGRTTNDTYFQDLAKLLMNDNYKVVLFDFSGHGESEGNDFDVTLSKSTKELEIIFEKEVLDKEKVSFVAFSYGATVMSNLLSQHKEINPEHIVLISPCIFPLQSCFLSEKSVFGKDIVEEQKNGELEKNGFAVVGAKDFRLSKKMLEECKLFSPDILLNYIDRILALSGKDDLILEVKYNDQFFKKYNIKNLWYLASHSLYEEIEKVFVDIEKFLLS